MKEAMTDWYRRTTWTEEDVADFNVRLKRARNQSQYLRIQACHLAEVGNHQAAIELLDRFITDYPDDLMIAVAYLQRAESHVFEGDLQSAIEAFRKSLDTQRKIPNVRTQAWILYPWLIVEHEMEEMYDEAGAVLSEFYEEGAVSCPIEEFRFFGVKALLAQHKGDLVAAQAFAKRAMEASAKTHSGYRYHPNIGLVQTLPDGIHKRLAAISSI